MGTKRDIDSGRKDSLGRIIKIASVTTDKPQRLDDPDLQNAYNDFDTEEGIAFDFNEIYEENLEFFIEEKRLNKINKRGENLIRAWTKGLECEEIIKKIEQDQSIDFPQNLYPEHFTLSPMGSGVGLASSKDTIIGMYGTNKDRALQRITDPLGPVLMKKSDRNYDYPDERFEQNGYREFLNDYLQGKIPSNSSLTAEMSIQGEVGSRVYRDMMKFSEAFNKMPGESISVSIDDNNGNPVMKVEISDFSKLLDQESDDYKKYEALQGSLLGYREDYAKNQDALSASVCSSAFNMAFEGRNISQPVSEALQSSVLESSFSEGEKRKIEQWSKNNPKEFHQSTFAATLKFMAASPLYDINKNNMHDIQHVEKVFAGLNDNQIKHIISSATDQLMKDYIRTGSAIGSQAEAQEKHTKPFYVSGEKEKQQENTNSTPVINISQDKLKNNPQRNPQRSSHGTPGRKPYIIPKRQTKIQRMRNTIGLFTSRILDFFRR